MSEKKKKVSIPIIVMAIIIAGLGGYIIYDKVYLPITYLHFDEGSNLPLPSEEELEKYKKEDVPTAATQEIDRRLYSLDSENNKQRYYLLLDDATYDIYQDFLQKKTYILDLNMTINNEPIREVDLSSALTPFAQSYIDEHKGDLKGNCTVEYFGSTHINKVPFSIDYENEVAFTAYYRCVEGYAETSLGTEIYAYNVETNTIRDLGRNDL